MIGLLMCLARGPCLGGITRTTRGPRRRPHSKGKNDHDHEEHDRGYAAHDVDEDRHPEEDADRRRYRWHEDAVALSRRRLLARSGQPLARGNGPGANISLPA